jgi:hypothetical protein
VFVAENRTVNSRLMYGARIRTALRRAVVRHERAHEGHADCSGSSCDEDIHANPPHALAHRTTWRESEACDDYRDCDRREGTGRNQNSVVTLERRDRNVAEIV